MSGDGQKMLYSPAPKILEGILPCLLLGGGSMGSPISSPDVRLPNSYPIGFGCYFSRKFNSAIVFWMAIYSMASNNDATGAPAAKEGDNKVTGAPSARASDRSNSNACCGLYKFGGQVHDPEETERALRAWDDSASSALARQLKRQILEISHYSRMVECVPRRAQEVTRDGLRFTNPDQFGGRFRVVVPRPAAPNEPATTVAECGPEDLPSP